MAWLTTFTIVKEFLEVEVLHVNHGIAGISGVVVGLIAGAVAGWVTWSQTGKGHDGHGHLARHAIEEHIKHAALKEPPSGESQ